MRMRCRRRVALHYACFGFPDLVQLIVFLDTQPDIRIDTQYPLELKHRLRLDGGFPLDGQADEFHRGFASSKNVPPTLIAYEARAYALLFFNAQFFTPNAIEIIRGLEVQFRIFNYMVQHLTVVIRQIAKREQRTDVFVG